MVRSDGADRRFHLFCAGRRAAKHGSLGHSLRFDPLQTTFLALGAYKKEGALGRGPGRSKNKSGTKLLFFCAGPETRTHVYFIAV